MLRTKKDNILNATESLILQQVNCRNVMGAGLAKAIYTKWPRVKDMYHSFCEAKEPYSLLGKVNAVKVEEGKYVVNVFGQLNYGRQNVRYTDYDALEKAFNEIASKTNLSIAIPYGFGCGLANGDWKVVYGLIEKYFGDKETTIYRLE